MSLPAVQPVLSVDPFLNKLLIKYAEETRAYRKYRGAFEVDLENMVASLLPHGKARLPEIAHRLGVSPRTLPPACAGAGRRQPVRRRDLVGNCSGLRHGMCGKLTR
jgi:hypothetical protein